MNFWSFIVQNRTEIAELTLEHLWIVGIATLLAVVVGIPLGILITRRPELHKPVIAAANIIQTIPSLALFGFLLPAPWIGERAARLAILALRQRDSCRSSRCHRDLYRPCNHCRCDRSWRIGGIDISGTCDGE